MSVPPEHQTDADTFNGSTDDAGHEHAVVANELRKALRTDDIRAIWRVGGHFHHDGLGQSQQECQHEDGVNGLDTEFPTQHLDGNAQKEDVDNEEGVVDREARGIEQDSSSTSQTARGDFIRELKTRKTCGVEHKTERDNKIILHVLHDGGNANFLSHSFWILSRYSKLF